VFITQFFYEWVALRVAKHMKVAVA
jgi:hypothetical protein